MQPTFFIYTALACEAKPLIARLGLKKDIAIQPFAVFKNNDICLTVTGIGKSAMAAAVAYTQALAANTESPAMINVGIAGHKEYKVGTPCLAHKISDADSGRNYYPTLVFTVPHQTETIATFSKSQFNYEPDVLIDMEASAFFETAARFTDAELIHCLKIVSDNQDAPANLIDAGLATHLIEQNTSVVEWLLSELKNLKATIHTPETNYYDDLVKTYRFTVSEQRQLKNLLIRWQALTDRQPIDFSSGHWHKAKDVLAWLEQQLTEVKYEL